MSEALRLADAIVYAACHDDVGIVVDVAADELRRQHAEIERLRALNAEMLTALGEIEWSNNTTWQRDRARAAIAKARAGQ